MTPSLPVSGESKRSRFFRRAALASTLAVAVGCSSPGGETLGSTQLAAYMNEKTVYDYFVGKGLTNFQSAGVVGNLIQESRLDPTIHQYNNGPGRGLAQWSAGARWDTTNGDNVAQYAAQHGNQNVYSLSLQLDFIWYELTTFANYGLTELKASTTLAQATQVFEDKFEGCVYAAYPVCALPQRIVFAQEILDAYGNSGGTGGAGGGGAGGAAGGGAAGSAAGGASGAAGASGGAGSGGVSAGGAGSGGAAGTPSVAGSTSTAGSTGVAGSTSTAGGTSVAGSTGTAGGTSVAGSTSTAGGAGVASSGFTPSNGDDAGCSFSPSKPRSSGGSWLLMGALVAATLRFGRRRP